MSDSQNENIKKPSCCTPVAQHDATLKFQPVAPNITTPAPPRPTTSLPGGTFLMGTDYRHADEADFDRELDIERRMNEAVAPST